MPNDKRNDEFENLKEGYEQVKHLYDIELDKLKTSDDKINMILVFNAAILALLFSVIPFPTNKVKMIISFILFGLFILSMILTLIFIFIAFKPRNVYSIEPSSFIDPNTYNCSKEEFIGKYTKGYVNSIDSISRLAEIKQGLIKKCMYTTIFNILLMVVMIIIKVI